MPIVGDDAEKGNAALLATLNSRFALLVANMPRNRAERFPCLENISFPNTSSLEMGGAPWFPCADIKAPSVMPDGREPWPTDVSAPEHTS